MRREMLPFERRGGTEDQEHAALSDPEEDVPPCLFAHQGKAQDIAIESLSLVQVVGVDASLDHGLDGFHGESISARIRMINACVTSDRILPGRTKNCGAGRLPHSHEWPARRALARVARGHRRARAFASVVPTPRSTI